MCTVTLNINEAQVRELNPSLTNTASITRWAQRIIDSFIADHRVSHAADKPLKPYTIEELHARIAQSERDIAEGKGQDFDDFMRELEEEFAEEDRKELAVLEAV